MRRQGKIGPEKSVLAVMQLYRGTRLRVKTSERVSEEFEIEVGVHQGSPLHFIIWMELVTKEERGREKRPWELLYADDLALTAETGKQLKERFYRWKVGIERRGLRINIDKTKMMLLGKMATNRVQFGRWPYGCCGTGVGSNSILCSGPTGDVQR